MNKVINTQKAINEIINKLEKVNGNIFLYDSSDDTKLCLDFGAIQILKAYYISRRKYG